MIRGKAIALWSAGVGVAVLLIAGITSKDWLVEEWHIRKLDTKDFTERFGAAKKLGEMRSTRAIPQLVTLLRESEEHKKEAGEMVSIFSEIGPATIPALAHALRDSRGEKKWWRRCACRALGEIRASEAVPALLYLLDDPDTCVRLLAFRALGELGPKAKDAIPALTRIAGNQTAASRHSAKTTLARIQAPQPESTR